LRRFLSKYGFTLGIITALIMVGVVFIYTLSFNSLINKYQDKLINAFTKALSEQTGLQLKIENINAEFPFLVAFSGVTIKDENSHELFSAKEVVVKADWMTVIKNPKEALLSIRYVEFNEPVFKGTIKKGKLDWLELLSRKPVRKKIPVSWDDVNLKLSLNSGKIDLAYVKEKNGVVEETPFALPFRIFGQVIIADGKLTIHPKLRFVWSGKNINDNNATAAKVFPGSGEFIVINGHGGLDNEIKFWGKVDFKGFEQYFPLVRNLIKPIKNEDLEIELDKAQGKFEANVANLTGDSPTIKAEFQLDLLDTKINSGRFPDMDLSIDSGVLRFSYPESSLDFACNGKIKDSIFDANIHLDRIYSGNLQGSLQIKAIPLDLLPVKKLPINMNIEGGIDVKSWLSGTLDDIVISGEVSSDSIRINKIPFRFEESLFIFNKGELSLPDARLIGYSNEAVEFAAYSFPVKKEFASNIRAKGLPFSFYEDTIKFHPPFAIDGRPAVIASIIAKPGNFSSRIELDMSEGKIATVPCSDMHASLDVLNRDVKIDEIVFTPYAGGRFKADGAITLPNKIDLEFNIAEVKLSDSLKEDESVHEPLRGILFGKGDIHGTFSNPELTSSLRIYEAEIYNWSFESAQVDFGIDSSGLKYGKAIINATGSNMELNVEYIFNNPRPMVLWGNWENIPIGVFTKDAVNRKLVISGDGEFIGDADDLNGIIRISIDGEDSLGNRLMTSNEEPFTGTFLDIDLGGIGKINSFTEMMKIFSRSNIENTKDEYLKKGRLEVTGGLRFESLAQQSEISNLLSVLKTDILTLIPNAELSIPVDKSIPGFNLALDGFLDVEFSMEKRSGSWFISGIADGHEFKIQNEPIEILHADINTLANGDYKLALNFSQGEGEFAIKGQIRWEEVIGSSPMELDLTIDSYPIKSLARLGKIESDNEFDGLMSGSGKVKGTPLKPTLQDINLSFQKAHIFGIPIDENKMIFSWVGGRISIDKFELSGEEGFHVFAAGSIELDPSRVTDSRIDLRVDNLSLQKLKLVKFIPEGTSGSLSLITQLGYDPVTKKPKVYIDLNLDKPSYRGIGIDQIAGQGIIDSASGDMKVGRMDCRLGENSVSINGIIHLTSDKSQGELDLKVLAKNFDFIPLLQKISIPIEADISNADLDLDVKGTLSRPSVSGKVRMEISKPTFEKTNFADDINAEFDVVNNKVNLREDNVHINRNGSSIVAQGAVDFGWLFNGIELTRLRSPEEESFVIDLVNDDNKPFPIDVFGVNAKVIFKGKNSESGIRMSLNHGKILLSGVVEIVEGRYNISAIPQPSSKKGTSPVELDMTVLFPKGFPVRSGDTIDIYLSDSRFNISGTPAYPSADGTLKIESGQLRLLDRTFNIEEAVLQFKPFFGIDNPYLKGRATTVIVSQSIRNFAGTENIRVTAQIDARLRQLTSGIKFTSNRGTMTESELMGVLMRQDLFQDFQEEGLLTTLSQQAFTIPGAFLSRFFETRGGFQNFQIGVDFEKDIFLNFEYEAFPNWFFDFYYLFASDSELDLGLKYMFRRDSFVGVATDEDGSIILKFDYVIPLR